MTLTPGLRKLVLSLHLAVSVGWIGAIVAYVSLAVAAMSRQDAQTVRGAWMAMEVTIRFVIVPLALGSLLTGLVMALGTKWGLFRHYWVLISLVLTIFATAVLLSHVQTVRALAEVAAEWDAAAVPGRQSRSGQEQPHEQAAHLAEQLIAGLPGELLHAGGGLAVLLVVQVLNVYKPVGMTRYGWRKQQEEHRRRRTALAP